MGNKPYCTRQRSGFPQLALLSTLVKRFPSRNQTWQWTIHNLQICLLSTITSTVSKCLAEFPPSHVRLPRGKKWFLVNRMPSAAIPKKQMYNVGPSFEGEVVWHKSNNYGLCYIYHISIVFTGVIKPTNIITWGAHRQVNHIHCSVSAGIPSRFFCGTVVQPVNNMLQPVVPVSCKLVIKFTT